MRGQWESVQTCNYGHQDQTLQMATEDQALPLRDGKCGPHNFSRADMPPMPSSHGISRGLMQLLEPFHASQIWHQWSQGIFLKLIALRFHKIALCIKPNGTESLESPQRATNGFRGRKDTLK